MRTGGQITATASEPRVLRQSWAAVDSAAVLALGRVLINPTGGLPWLFGTLSALARGQWLPASHYLGSLRAPRLAAVSVGIFVDVVEAGAGEVLFSACVFGLETHDAVVVGVPDPRRVLAVRARVLVREDGVGGAAELVEVVDLGVLGGEAELKGSDLPEGETQNELDD